MSPKQKITTYLWFDSNAEEAMNHYVSIFKNSKVVSVTRYGEARPAGRACRQLLWSARLERCRRYIRAPRSRHAARTNMTTPMMNSATAAIMVKPDGKPSMPPSPQRTMPTSATIAPIITPRGGNLPDGLISVISTSC
jgi:hypothetical protein